MEENQKLCRARARKFSLETNRRRKLVFTNLSLSFNLRRHASFLVLLLSWAYIGGKVVAGLCGYSGWLAKIVLKVYSKTPFKKSCTLSQKNAFTAVSPCIESLSSELD